MEAISTAEALADAILHAAGSALRYYEPETRKRIVCVAQACINEARATAPPKEQP